MWEASLLLTVLLSSRRHAAEAAPVVQTTPAWTPLQWGYVDVTGVLPPTFWRTQYPSCSGERQSPITIYDHATELDIILESMDFSAWHRKPLGDAWTVVDNGHSVQFSANFNRPPQLSRGGLSETYVFTQFHFHWGAVDSRGAEHVINDKRFPLEMHVVHQKSSDTAASANLDPTGIAVLAILFELATENDPPNNQLDALTKAVQMATEPNVPVNATLRDITLADFLPESPGFYRYLGSLTTPPCAEAVVWTIMKQPMKVTEAQLQAFRSLRAESSGPSQGSNQVLVDNTRPVQKINGRIIYHHPDDWDDAVRAVRISVQPINI